MKILDCNGRLLYEDEAETARETLIAAVGHGAYLDGAYLRGANLGGANLDVANLGGANLDGAYLRGASFRGANLRGAYLRGANLGGAYLDGANLRGAYLRGASLGGARLNWQSHDLIAELLLRAAGQDVEKRKAAGLILVSRDWCWREFLRIDDPSRDWVLDTLAAWVTEGDNAPDVLRVRAKDTSPIS